MSLQNIYIDADIFWHCTAFDRTKCEPKLGIDNLIKISDSCKNPEIFAVIPQVTLGECLVNAFNDEIDIDDLLRFIKMLDPILESPTREIFEKVRELMISDSWLTGNDALFIAHALCNVNTTTIVSTDGIFRSSGTILEELRSHPKRPRVRETFRK